MKISTLIFFFFFLLNFSYAQEQYRINGLIMDNESREVLFNATVESEKAGTTISDNAGKFELFSPTRKVILKISFLGYENLTDTLFLKSDTTLVFYLQPKSVAIKDVSVSAQKSDIEIKGPTATTIHLTKKEISQLPTLLGEPDVLRVVQLAPGVQAANEGNSGFYVRGGGTDQNLVLLDKATIYNPSHVLGFFSVFNADAISQVNLIKSGMPADYGGRMSSVLEVEPMNGDFRNYHGSANIGLISSRLSVNGPIIKDKMSLLLAGRRSYIDEALKPVGKKFAGSGSTFYNNSTYFFYDLNGRLSIRPDSTSILSLNYYQGSDDYSLHNDGLDYQSAMQWGNRVGSVSYRKWTRNGWQIEAGAALTSYRLMFDAQQYEINIGLQSSIENYAVKTHFSKRMKSGLQSFGMEYQRYNFVPNNLNALANGTELDFGTDQHLSAHEASVFYNFVTNISGRWSMSAGIRSSIYLQTGPYTQYVRDQEGEKTDSLVYRKGDIVKPYGGVEPRLSFGYQLTERASVKASYTHHIQYVHLASASSVTLPTDVWLPSTANIKPQTSEHFSAGYYRLTRFHHISFSIEAYYKFLDHQIELLSGIIDDFQDKLFEESMVFGKGKSYGTELFIQRNQGKLHGWIGYTLSRTSREFDDIDNGRIYPAKFDRTHDLNFVLVYDLNSKWSLSSTFIFATGNAMTLPSYKYLISGNMLTGSDCINTFRMPAYHRLDFAVNYYLLRKTNLESFLNLSVYNVYNRPNPYFIYFEIQGNIYEYNLKITPKQITLFPIIPSISWSVKF